MSFDLLSAVKGLFTGDVVSQAAARLGESETGIQKAISSIVPTILAGLLHKAGPQGDATSALAMSREAVGANTPSAISGALQQNAGGWLGKGTEWLQGLFGNKVTTVTTAVASFAGIKASSAGTLLHAATPAALGVAGEHAADQSLNAAGFLTFLNTQQDTILSAVPPGFNLAGLLGLGSLGELGKKLSGMADNIGARVQGSAAETTRQVTGSNRWIWSLLLIVAAIVLLWYFARGCGGGNVTDDVATDSIAAASPNPVDPLIAPIDNSEIATTRESIKVTLPDGVTLDAYKGGIEDQLVQFLKDDRRQARQDVWFDFDNLNFKSGGSELTEDSREQVQHIAAILKAFPKAKIKIGGYTDRTGDSLANMQLSQARATAVLTALQGMDVDADQLLGAEGYGSQFARAPANAPDEERKKDRRISISVREK